MPHVIVKLWPGRSEADKTRLADLIVRDVVEVIGCREEVVTVGIEEIAREDWPQKVFEPDIVDKAATLYRKPGYKM